MKIKDFEHIPASHASFTRAYIHQDFIMCKHPIEITLPKNNFFQPGCILTSTKGTLEYWPDKWNNRACFGTAGAPKHRSLKTQLPYLALYVAPHYLVTNPRCVAGSCFFFSVWFVVNGGWFRFNLSHGALKTLKKLTTLRFFHLKITRWGAHLPRWASPFVDSKGLTDLYITHPYWFYQKANVFMANICLSQVSKFLGRE